ncbi:GNAT family N-acetyltransferase, partial [uncultured Thiodictyon sp.]|uniref:GNAT family N-acetyltransferase n=1 Tax=uncultured Thiodictyon sp. TaxID=1846217 RepID=UPI0025DC171C
RIDATGRESEPLGFARCLRLTPGGEVAEFSVATVDGIQGQGVGSALLSHLIPAAQRQGIRRFRFDVLPENTGMRRLAQCFCGDAKWVDDGTLEYDCGLPEPIPADPATWSKRPASRPVVTALPRGVTLYLSPAGVVASCAATWGLSLARYLAGTAQPPTRLSVIGWRGAAQRPASPGATRPKLHHRDPSVRPRLRDFGRSS